MIYLAPRPFQVFTALQTLPKQGEWITVDHKEFAETIGMTKSHFSTIISGLVKQGVIEWRMPRVQPSQYRFTVKPSDVQQARQNSGRKRTQSNRRLVPYAGAEPGYKPGQWSNG